MTAEWKQAAMPSEHGGWGLTLEPVLLGLLIAPSWGGLSLGLAAFAAFLVRTPLKLVVIDRRRTQWQRRSQLALRFAVGEMLLLSVCGVWAVAAAGLVKRRPAPRKSRASRGSLCSAVSRVF